jgi:hypothetical protein
LRDNSFVTAAIKREPIPDPNPLITTISNGVFEDKFFVQLFSNPQNMQASKTNIDPTENEKLL